MAIYVTLSWAKRQSCGFDATFASKMIIERALFPHLPWFLKVFVKISDSGYEERIERAHIISRWVS